MNIFFAEEGSCDEDDVSNEFIDDQAMEGSDEDTPSEDSNAIIDEGESLGSTTTDDESYDDEASLEDFVVNDDDVEDDLLSGDEDFLGTQKQKLSGKKHKRILIVSDDEESDIETNSAPTIPSENQKPEKEESNSPENSSEDEIDKLSMKPFGGMSPSVISDNQISVIDSDDSVVKRNEKLSKLIENDNNVYNSDDSKVQESDSHETNQKENIADKNETEKLAKIFNIEKETEEILKDFCDIAENENKNDDRKSSKRKSDEMIIETDKDNENCAVKENNKVKKRKSHDKVADEEQESVLNSEEYILDLNFPKKNLKHCCTPIIEPDEENKSDRNIDKISAKRKSTSSSDDSKSPKKVTKLTPPEKNSVEGTISPKKSPLNTSKNKEKINKTPELKESDEANSATVDNENVTKSSGKKKAKKHKSRPEKPADSDTSEIDSDEDLDISQKCTPAQNSGKKKKQKSVSSIEETPANKMRESEEHNQLEGAQNKKVLYSFQSIEEISPPKSRSNRKKRTGLSNLSESFGEDYEDKKVVISPHLLKLSQQVNEELSKNAKDDENAEIRSKKKNKKAEESVINSSGYGAFVRSPEYKEKLNKMSTPAFRDDTNINDLETEKKSKKNKKNRRSDNTFVISNISHTNMEDENIQSGNKEETSHHSYEDNKLEKKKKKGRKCTNSSEDNMAVENVSPQGVESKISPKKSKKDGRLSTDTFIITSKAEQDKPEKNNEEISPNKAENKKSKKKKKSEEENVCFITENDTLKHETEESSPTKTENEKQGMKKKKERTATLSLDDDVFTTKLDVLSASQKGEKEEKTKEDEDSCKYSSNEEKEVSPKKKGKGAKVLSTVTEFDSSKKDDKSQRGDTKEKKKKSSCDDELNHITEAQEKKKNTSRSKSVTDLNTFDTSSVDVENEQPQPKGRRERRLSVKERVSLIEKNIEEEKSQHKNRQKQKKQKSEVVKEPKTSAMTFVVEKGTNIKATKSEFNCNNSEPPKPILKRGYIKPSNFGSSNCSTIKIDVVPSRLSNMSKSIKKKQKKQKYSQANLNLISASLSGQTKSTNFKEEFLYSNNVKRIDSAEFLKMKRKNF